MNIFQLAAVEQETPQSFIDTMNNYVETFCESKDPQTVAEAILTNHDSPEEFSQAVVNFLFSDEGSNLVRLIIQDDSVVSTLQHPFYGDNYGSVVEAVKHYVESVYMNLEMEVEVENNPTDATTMFMVRVA